MTTTNKMTLAERDAAIMALVENNSGEATPIYIYEFAKKIRTLMAQEVEPVSDKDKLIESIKLAFEIIDRETDGIKQGFILPTIKLEAYVTIRTLFDNYQAGIAGASRVKP